MKSSFKYLMVLALVCGITTGAKAQNKDMASEQGWISLFNGKSLDGWKVGNNAETFSIENGAIKVSGKTAHLFYMGDVGNHDFTNFEFKATVMTRANSNSGIYIHTRYQEGGWPEYGYEVQVNNSHGDWRRTGSLYGIVDVKESYVPDDVWYTEYIKVEGKRIIIKINDIVVVDYTEPEHPLRDDSWAKRLLSHGTFALQGHDPGSTVFYKEIMVKPLP